MIFIFYKHFIPLGYFGRLVWTAKAGFEETGKGSIEVGKSVDFVLLDTDLKKCHDEVILQAKVMKTVLSGEAISEN